MGYVLLTFAVILNSVANILFKHASGISDWSLPKVALFCLALFLGLGNTLLYIKSLEVLDLGVAYPILSAASILLITGLSVFFFKETVSIQKLVALATICVGMLLLWKA